MNLNDYAAAAASYRVPTADSSYVTANLVSEVGEFFGHVAKFQRDGGDEQAVLLLLKKELGDILWHVSAIADDIDSNLGEIAQMNLDKLDDRAKRNKIQGSGDTR